MLKSFAIKFIKSHIIYTIAFLKKLHVTNVSHSFEKLTYFTEKQKYWKMWRDFNN